MQRAGTNKKGCKRRPVYFLRAGELLALLLMLSILPLPVAPACFVDFMVELLRDARVAPVAGAVLMGLSVRCPFAGEAVGCELTADGAGVSALLVEERCAAELDPFRLGEDCAEAAVMLKAKAAKTRRLFINNRS
jgi:hypothetical protein